MNICKWKEGLKGSASKKRKEKKENEETIWVEGRLTSLTPSKQSILRQTLITGVIEQKQY